MKNVLKTAAAGLIMLAGAAMADDWPKKSINLTVGYGAGGTTDSTARVLASLLEEDLGVSVTVINKPGGGGSVAAALGSAERPDGYNIFTFTTGAAVLSPHTQDLPYDTLKRLHFHFAVRRLASRRGGTGRFTIQFSRRTDGIHQKEPW